MSDVARRQDHLAKALKLTLCHPDRFFFHRRRRLWYSIEDARRYAVAAGFAHNRKQQVRGVKLPGNPIWFWHVRAVPLPLPQPAHLSLVPEATTPASGTPAEAVEADKACDCGEQDCNACWPALAAYEPTPEQVEAEPVCNCGGSFGNHRNQHHPSCDTNLPAGDHGPLRIT